LILKDIGEKIYDLSGKHTGTNLSTDSQKFLPQSTLNHRIFDTIVSPDGIA